MIQSAALWTNLGLLYHFRTLYPEFFTLFQTLLFKRHKKDGSNSRKLHKKIMKNYQSQTEEKVGW